MLSEGEKRDILEQAAALREDFARMPQSISHQLSLDDFLGFLTSFSHAWGAGVRRAPPSFWKALI